MNKILCILFRVFSWFKQFTMNFLSGMAFMQNDVPRIASPISKKKINSKGFSLASVGLILMTIYFTTFLNMQGCSSFQPVKQCVDCTQFPLIYQGTITEYTLGYYIETACLTIDLGKFTGLENFQVGDIIFVEYVLKQGNFCEPNDQSKYKVYTIKNDKALDESPGQLEGPASGIKLKQ